jgi:hypothetical protein
MAQIQSDMAVKCKHRQKRTTSEFLALVTDPVNFSASRTMTYLHCHKCRERRCEKMQIEGGREVESKVLHSRSEQ